jgi:hypothetical protein
MGDWEQAHHPADVTTHASTLTGTSRNGGFWLAIASTNQKGSRERVVHAGRPVGSKSRRGKPTPDLPRVVLGAAPGQALGTRRYLRIEVSNYFVVSVCSWKLLHC